MSDEAARPPTYAALAVDADDAGSAAPSVLLDMMRQLRARERGHLAGLLHDGPIQQLAALALELGEVRAMGHRRAMSWTTSPGRFMPSAGSCAASRMSSGPFRGRGPA